MLLFWELRLTHLLDLDMTNLLWFWIQTREAHRIKSQAKFDVCLRHGYSVIDFKELESVEMLKSYDNYHFLIALLNPLYKEDS